MGGRNPTLLWRQRRILGEVVPTDGTSHSHLYAVLSPDGDVYLEDYSGRDPGVAAVRFSATRRSLPPGVPGGQTYRFRDEISDDEYTSAVTAGEEAAEEWWGCTEAEAPTISYFDLLDPKLKKTTPPPKPLVG